MAGKIFNQALSFLRDERGATAMEYGLILAAISVVVATAASTIGTKLTGTFTAVAAFLS